MMEQRALGRLHDIGYARARQLLLLVGLGALALIAAVMYVRRVDTIEVVATLFFMLVLGACVFWKVPGGLTAGTIAALAYASLRYPAIQAVGLDRFVGLILSRAVAYVAFGALGGWAMDTLEASLTKLELYDQIDDETGLYNARHLLRLTDLEVSRAQRYRTLFSVAILEVPAAALSSGLRRPAVRLFEVGHVMRAGLASRRGTVSGSRKRTSLLMGTSGQALVLATRGHDACTRLAVRS
jgi:hypothetical protein